MKQVTCTHTAFAVVEGPEPEPAAGQVRIEIERCGICGSDLHARTSIDEVAGVAAEIGYDRLGRSSEPLVFGHEFSGKVAEYGPGGAQSGVPTGAPVVAMPLIRTANGIDAVGLSIHAPGGYAEQMLVQESLMLPVPNGLPADVAALTEPMAVAWHAVRRGEVSKRDVAIVIGCGPVGLGVILCLKAQGVKTIVAADFSPGRRKLAEQCGADVVVDPKLDSPYEARDDKHLTNAADAFELAVGTREKLGKLPIGWWHTWRLGEKLGAGPKRPIIFECVGVPGVIESIVTAAPLFSRVVVVGVCMGEDRFRPSMAINKEIDLRFVLGYTPLEFRDTLHMLADGKIDPRPLMTGTVGLGGVDAAFAALGDPESHAKILIDPRSDATEPAVGPT